MSATIEVNFELETDKTAMQCPVSFEFFYVMRVVMLVKQRTFPDLKINISKELLCRLHACEGRRTRLT